MMLVGEHLQEERGRGLSFFFTSFLEVFTNEHFLFFLPLSFFSFFLEIFSFLSLLHFSMRIINKKRRERGCLVANTSKQEVKKTKKKNDE
jgi:uncharacterized protein YacL